MYLENSESLDLIERWDSPDTLFYVDPPYLASTRTSKLRGYQFEMTDEDHRELATRLHQVRGHVILSGYPSTLYDDELYVDWVRVTRCSLADKGKSATEVLWLSPNTPRPQPGLFD